MAETVRYGTQTKARRVALDVLYAAELRGRGIVETFIEARDLTAITVRELTTRIVHGVAEHQEEVDARISAALDKSWTLERMPAVDRNLARIAIFEMDHRHPRARRHRRGGEVGAGTVHRRFTRFSQWPAQQGPFNQRNKLLTPDLERT